MLMLADDAILMRRVGTEEDGMKVQDNINILQNYTKKWPLEFRISKCKIVKMKTESIRTA